MRQLSVKPIQKKLSDKGVVTLSADVADDLSLESGDVVRIERDGRPVYARFYDTTEGDIVRMNAKLRSELGVSINETVEVGETDVGVADNIDLTVPDELNAIGNLEQVIVEDLYGRVVWPESRKTVRLNESIAVPAEVEEMQPHAPAIVTQTTTVNVVEVQESETTDVSYNDIGGLNDELNQVREMVELPTQHPELFERVDTDAPNGIILHGPPGTGKTLMAKAVAGESDSYFESISGPEIMSKFYGESESRIREVFERAAQNAPAIVFIDELDSIAPKRSESDNTERRVVAQLLAIMDGLEERDQVTVIAATNRLDVIDPALRRPGRFDREVEIGVPSKEARRTILTVHTRDMPLADDVDLDLLAEETYGFVGADLENLARESAMNALRRVEPDLDLGDGPIPRDKLQEIEVTLADVKEARRDIEPSAMREVFVEAPDVSWEQVGGLADTKSRVKESVEWPMQHADVLEEFAIDPPSGVLLYGPPGTGKTLMAKAVANESNANFISVQGPELLDKYVGESEKGVREIFKKARENVPTVLFFDELDAIAASRGSNDSTNVTERVVSQLLTELDGLEALEDVTVIATTNRPDLLDSALLRPGRLDRQIHVPVPDAEARRQILEIHTADMPTDGLDYDKLVDETENFVGADIEALCREASMVAVRERLDGDGTDTVTMAHFREAFDEVGGSVSEEAREKYEEIEDSLAGGTVEDENDRDDVGRSAFA